MIRIKFLVMGMALAYNFPLWKHDRRVFHGKLRMKPLASTIRPASDGGFLNEGLVWIYLMENKVIRIQACVVRWSGPSGASRMETKPGGEFSLSA